MGSEETQGQQPGKVFNDPVHGHMELHPLCVAIIKTPEFDRLRYLKQLGACYFVYPGASHNRFEHSLGVCFLAGQLVNHLKGTQPELKINRKDVLCVQIAGLCHDLGHGPFSHIFDMKFIPKVRPGEKWTHEDASVQMFDHMVKKNDLEPVFDRYEIGAEERVFIKEQIVGKPLTKTSSGKTWYYEPESKKSFLYEIVANKRNGVDVDKWDYFKRDSQCLGMTTSFDHMRCIKFTRVIDVDGDRQIGFRDKEAFNMYDMFRTRHALHRRAYQHKVVQAVDLMLCEAFKEADEFIRIPGKNGKELKISQCIHDMDAYSQLTDGLFHHILFSQDPQLKKAQGFLQDIQKRKLFRCVAETQPLSGENAFTKKGAGDDIKKEIQEEAGLDASVFRVQISELGYGMKGKSLFDKIQFYTKDLKPAPPLRTSEVSCMIPQKHFKEQVVRVFLIPTKDEKTDEQNAQRLIDGLEKWCARHEMETPTKYFSMPGKPDGSGEGN